MPDKKRKSETGMFRALSDGLKTLHIIDSRKTATEQLVLMNIPALAARRDTAYRAAKTIIQQYEHATSGEMLSAYTDILRLLNIADKAHKDMKAAIASQTKKKLPAPHLGPYLQLLIDLVSAALFLLNSSAMVCSDTPEIKYAIGDNRKFSPENMLETFASMELQIRTYLLELLESSAPNIAKAMEKTRKSFSDMDKTRYNEAFKALLEHFYE